ncbi:lipopolysaccharide biosynthesis protein [Saccharicrinis aurantiacus]|uniref:lipopolysaccharide biosynthesis protein n=1 Tax=Saccharicrinis aurantiacus TaxID=1849719 RepID=UPI00249236C6|nr:polysaccharide biosynthesis C-terminal domain-containing protein [Saccharicrinis aurantiacus]
MGKFKSLASETVIYGGGTILVRLLNWLLMPYYIRTMDLFQYGLVTNIYSYIAIFLVILTYGFETTFFRFAKKDDFKTVFTTAFISICSSSILFLLLLYPISDNIASSNYTDLIKVAGLLVAIDAVSALIFAKLRFDNRSIKFALLKLINVLVIIGLNVFFLRICPIIVENYSADSILYKFVHIVYSPGREAYFVLISNLLASIVVLLFLVKTAISSIGKFDFTLLLRMYKYSLPILIVGITGMINQNIDKILLPKLIGGDEGIKQLAIYGANFKIGVLMAMFTQSFRMAFEPFFFKHHRESNDNSIYNNILTYFTIFGFFIFLGVCYFLDVINLFLTSDYLEGNVIIPIVLLAQLLSGVYFTLSVWYKVSDNTKYGALMGIVGCIVTVLLNFVLVPIFGYIGAAISSLFGYAIMVLQSIYYSNKIYPIYYNWKKISLYGLLTISLYLITYIFNTFFSNTFDTLLNYIFRYSLSIGLLIVFLLIVYKNEFKNLKKAI